MDQRARVVVIGMGGIGGVVSALLQRAARHDVMVCSQQRISELTLEEPDATTQLAVKTLVDPGEVTSSVNWILLCTKAHDTGSAAPWLARLCRPDTRVAVLQNGINQTSLVAPFVGGATVIPTIVHFNGERIAPDHARFRHARNDDLTFPDTAAGRAFIQLLEGTSLKVEARPDFKTLQWRKLLLNAAANPLTTLTRQRLAVLRRDDIRVYAWICSMKAPPLLGQPELTSPKTKPRRSLIPLWVIRLKAAHLCISTVSQADRSKLRS
jgi:2-dehydropantoate 2-reductase